MLKSIVLIILFSVMVNWMISLAMVAQVSSEKNNRIRFFSLAFVSGLITGYIIYLL